MYNILNGVTDISIARDKINSNLDYVYNDIDKYLKSNNYNLGFDINFGYNYFPKKEFKGITYKEGNYTDEEIELFRKVVEQGAPYFYKWAKEGGIQIA